MPPRRKAAQKPVDNKQKILENFDLQGFFLLVHFPVSDRISQLQTQAQMLSLSLDYSCKAILQRLSSQVKNMTLSELYSRYQGDMQENHALG